MKADLYFFVLAIIAVSCAQKNTEITVVTDMLAIQDSTPKVEKRIQEDLPNVQSPMFNDSILTSYISSLGLDEQYDISTNHNPYMITGYFNLDDIGDTAILLQDKKTNKVGLLIKHGASKEHYLLGAGQEVLSQKFDDFNWVGVFQKVNKGTKSCSNIDEETGEIMLEDVPDSLKTTLPADGIYIHASESCGGGIIYWDHDEYNWIQQE
ncbi:hypothetical protein [Sporocytophaga myxococcoides]|uniref:hypothetical protein n=1 Tax=Sporocytophaga myxococcoides TaxID=153721 RepID=UPI00040C2C06|nr:hypothetical protein [Sporocytophaga myxococcoides]